MSPADEADRRIERLELELARIQTDETAPLQLLANLRRQSLGSTLAKAAFIATTAHAVIRGVLDVAIDKHLDQLGEALAPKDPDQ